MKTEFMERSDINYMSEFDPALIFSQKLVLDLIRTATYVCSLRSLHKSRAH